MKHFFKALSFFTLSLTTSLYAADFKLQNIRVGGVGCPTELTTIVLAPDSSSASLIFSQFESRVPVLNSGPKVSRNISTLNCNIFLDVKVPAGVKLDALEVSYDMRGFATLDRGVQGSFKSFLVSKNGLGTENTGGRGPETLAEKSWFNIFSNQEEDFTVSATKSLSIPSQCARGSDTDIVSIRLQHTLSSQILAGFESQAQGNIVMDSSDIKGGLRLSARTTSCNGANPQPGGGRNCRLVRVGGRTQQVCI